LLIPTSVAGLSPAFFNFHTIFVINDSDFRNRKVGYIECENSNIGYLFLLIDLI